MNTCIVALASVSTLAIDEAQLRDASPQPSVDRAWFEPTRWLGPRGFKYHSPATRYWLAAVDQALRAATIEVDERSSDQHALVLGTNFAVHELLREMERQFVDEGVRGVSPMNAPNFSVNIPASVAAMQAQLRGFCLTLTTPQVAGLQALREAERALEQQRATCVVAGATEVALADDTHLVEGACAFVLEPEARALARGVSPRARLLGGLDTLVPREQLSSPDVPRWQAWWAKLGERLLPNPLTTPTLVLDVDDHGLSASVGLALRHGLLEAARARGLRVELAGEGREHALASSGGTLGAVTRCARWIVREQAACVVELGAHGQVCAVTIAPVNTAGAA